MAEESTAIGRLYQFDRKCPGCGKLIGDHTLRGCPGAADGPLEGFLIPPEPTACDQAAAIICGHDFIRKMGVDQMSEFHGFVQEVLATTVEPEIQRLQRQRP